MRKAGSTTDLLHRSDQRGFCGTLVSCARRLLQVKSIPFALLYVLKAL